MKIYLAGPMSGYPRWNFPAFEAAAAQLRALGYEVVSPAENDLAHGVDPNAPGFTFTEKDYADAMRRDVAILLEVDGVALLDGWNESRGASLEAQIGLALGLEVGTLSAFTGKEGRL